jgi:nicotinate-nucleotide adenylyltransferase
VKVGLMGGTFDPIHLGHLRAAENAREALGLDAVSFVPSSEPPHRPAPVANGRDRYAMAALATAGHPGFAVSDVELRREGPSFTVDTLRIWAEARPGDEIVLLLGSDAFAELGSWREVDAVLALCRVAVVARPGDVPRPGPSKGELRVDGPGLELSSSDVRRRVAEGRSVRYMVPDGVADYIHKQGLYR